jgi:trans-aconitate 2-methyltransferase
MNSEWDANLYLNFLNQRTQPARDLLSRISTLNPKTVIDIGCGTGNSTELLSQCFQKANIMGLDSSSEMLKKAKKNIPNVTYKHGDANALEGNYDLIFSNACFQWIPDHAAFIPFLMDHLTPGGVLAAQFPMNKMEPLFQIIFELVADPHWGLANTTIDYNGTLEPDAYFNLLSSCSHSFQIWETKYYHHLQDHQALINWVKGSRIRPYLSVMSKKEGEEFENAILEKVKKVYPVMKNGEVVLHFNRFFMIAVK